MTLQQLLEAMNAAKAALDKNPEDESLKAAFSEAKKAYEDAKVKAEGEGSDGDDELDESALDDKAQAYLKKLRNENAKHRTKNKELASEITGMKGTLSKLKAAFGGDDDDVDPAEKAKTLSTHNEKLQVELGIAQLALEHGITKDSQNYFRFLLAQKFESLEEGDEISDEDIQAIVQEAVKVSNAKTGKKNSTGVNSGGRPGEDDKSEMTVQQFAAMNIGEKSALYAKNPEQYKKLFTEAKDKNLIR